MSPTEESNLLSVAETDALRRLIGHAQGDSGQARKVADFLMAWWNPETWGSFALTDMFGVDEAIARDMVTTFTMIARVCRYPDSIGFAEEFEGIVRAWRPALNSNLG